jgi:hypothetical protein
MLRKLFVVAAAVTIPVSIIAVGGGFANAASPHTAAADTVSCKTLSGTMAFSRKVDSAGYTSGHTTITATITVSGCTVSGSTKLTITKGTGTGTLAGATGTPGKPTGSCTGLQGNTPATGTLNIKWTVSKGGGIVNSVLNVKSVKTGPVGSGSNEHGAFTIPGSTKGTAAGSFLGSDKGAKDKVVAEISLPYITMASTCLKSGLTSLKIQNESGTAAVALG